MADTYLTFDWDLGPHADFSDVAALFARLDEIVEFAIDVQTALDEEEASRIIARKAREFAYETESWPSPGERSEALADARAGRGEPRVQIEHASYFNPLQITVKVNFDFLVRLVEVIRDWGPRRQEARAKADMWETKPDCVALKWTSSSDGSRS